MATSAARAEAEVRGVPELKRKLGKLGDRAAELREPHARIGDRLLEELRRRTRRRTGELAGAWEVRSSDRSASLVNRADYAGVQEYGWPAGGIEGTFAIADAAAATEDAAVADYDEHVSDAIRSIDGGP